MNVSADIHVGRLTVAGVVVARPARLHMISGFGSTAPGAGRNINNYILQISDWNGVGDVEIDFEGHGACTFNFPHPTEFSVLTFPGNGFRFHEGIYVNAFPSLGTLNGLDDGTPLGLNFYYS